MNLVEKKRENGKRKEEKTVMELKDKKKKYE